MDTTALGLRTKTSPNAMADLLNNQDIKDWLKKLPEWDLEKNISNEPLNSMISRGRWIS